MNWHRCALFLGAVLFPVSAVAQVQPAPAPHPTPDTPRAGSGLPRTPTYLAVEGQPIDNRAPEKKDDQPLFPEQTRAPYHHAADFTVSEMTIEPHHFDTGTILGFNGTTEWALDSLAVEDALWIPREDQLRELLGGTFRSLARTLDGRFEVLVELAGRPEQVFGADSAADAYAEALLELLAVALERG